MILGIETSTREASLAVLDRESGAIVYERIFVTERAHNAVIFEPVEEILNQFRDRLAGIVVGLGPGSYGGVRVGISVANGLALAMGLPVTGRTSLEAWKAASDSYLVVGDARRGTLFVAEVIERKLQGEPLLVEVGEIGSILRPMRERGLSIHTPDTKVVELVDDAVLSFPEAATLASHFGDTQLERGVPQVLEPHYLRAPYITFPKGK